MPSSEYVRARFGLSPPMSERPRSATSSAHFGFSFRFSGLVLYCWKATVRRLKRLKQICYSSVLINPFKVSSLPPATRHAQSTFVIRPCCLYSSVLMDAIGSSMSRSCFAFHIFWLVPFVIAGYCHVFDTHKVSRPTFLANTLYSGGELLSAA